MAKTITPHKQGRTEILNTRITPEDKQSIEKAAKTLGISMADLIARMAELVRQQGLARYTLSVIRPEHYLRSRLSELSSVTEWKM